jgi:hypothetical protein
MESSVFKTLFDLTSEDFVLVMKEIFQENESIFEILNNNPVVVKVSRNDEPDIIEIRYYACISVMETGVIYQPENGPSSMILKFDKFFNLEPALSILSTPRIATNTFQLTWKSAKLDPPKEGGRYWCLIEEQNDLGKSHFQWNCSYHEIEKRWSDNWETYNVIYWTELAPMPF